MFLLCKNKFWKSNVQKCNIVNNIVLDLKFAKRVDFKYSNHQREVKFHVVYINI